MACFGDAHIKTEVFFMKHWNCAFLSGESLHLSQFLETAEKIISPHEKIFKCKKNPS